MRRCTRTEKRRFLSHVAETYGGTVESASFLGLLSENLVIGDPRSADTIIMAGYDTPKTRVMGCAFFPASSFLNGFLRVISVLLPAGLCAVLTVALSLPVLVGELTCLILLFGMNLLVPNKFNMNCNGSGLCAMFDILERRGTSRTCYVLLDNSDIASLGKRAFIKTYDGSARIIELYCVGMGDTVCVSYGRDAALPGGSAVPVPKRGLLGYRVSVADGSGGTPVIGGIKTAKDNRIDENAVLNVENYIEKELIK